MTGGQHDKTANMAEKERVSSVVSIDAPDMFRVQGVRVLDRHPLGGADLHKWWSPRFEQPSYTSTDPFKVVIDLARFGAW